MVFYSSSGFLQNAAPMYLHNHCLVSYSEKEFNSVAAQIPVGAKHFNLLSAFRSTKALFTMMSFESYPHGHDTANTAFFANRNCNKWKTHKGWQMAYHFPSIISSFLSTKAPTISPLLLLPSHFPTHQTTQLYLPSSSVFHPSLTLVSLGQATWNGGELERNNGGYL